MVEFCPVVKFNQGGSAANRATRLTFLSFSLYITVKSGIDASGEPIPSEMVRLG